MRRAGWREIVAVAVGGMLGTGLRLAADWVLPHHHDGFPLSTLIVNVVGSFLLGALVARSSQAPEWVRAGLGAGVLGSFTTFSAVAASSVTMAAASEWFLVALHVVATLLLGLGAAFVGLRTGAPPREGRS